MLKAFIAAASLGMAVMVVIAEGAADGNQLLRDSPALPLTALQQRGDEAFAATAGNWVTSDGFVRLQLSADGSYREARGPITASGRYSVDGTRVRFVAEDGSASQGRLSDGVLTVDLDKFRKQ